MANPITDQPALAVLQADIVALKQDVSSLLEHLKTRATTSSHETVAQLEAGARRIIRGATETGEQSAQAITKQVEEQPLIALLIALGIGFVGGRLLAR